MLDIFGGDLRFRVTVSFCVRHFALHAIERGSVASIAVSQMCVRRLTHSARAAMLRDQKISLGLRLGEFLLQLPQRSLQIFDLSFLIFDLLGKALAQITITSTRSSAARAKSSCFLSTA